jgi:DNA modification methylase
MENAIEKLWQDLHFQYASNPEPIPFHFREYAINNLNEVRSKSNKTAHGIYPYSGRIYPYIPLVLLSVKELCSPKGKILDPFAGSGTILLESLINPYYKRSAIGIEINPMGRLISKVKTTPLDQEIVNDKKDKLINDFEVTRTDLLEIPRSNQHIFWYSNKGLKELAKLKYCINNLKNDDYKDFFWLNFAFLARKISRADPYIPPAVLLKPYKYENSPKKINKINESIQTSKNPDVIRLFSDLVIENAKKIAFLDNFQEITEHKKSSRIIWDDAREMRYGTLQNAGKLDRTKSKKIPKNSIDLIITSPPYLTAQKYIRASMLEILWLEDVLDEKRIEIEKHSIGTELVSLNNVCFKEIGITNIDELVRETSLISKQRAVEVFQYFKDMKIVIEEMHWILKKGCYAVLIVGNNKVAGKTIETYRYLELLGNNCGFLTELILKDPIRSRGMITKRHGNGGLIKDEYVLVLKKGTQ